jgi:hypothetical protein
MKTAPCSIFLITGVLLGISISTVIELDKPLFIIPAIGFFVLGCIEIVYYYNSK